MATSPSSPAVRCSSPTREERPDVRTIALAGVSATATEEEAAAVVAALTTYFEEEPTQMEQPRNFWASAGRLEAQGRPVDRLSLGRGWCP
jgi:hypothetical protein